MGKSEYSIRAFCGAGDLPRRIHFDRRIQRDEQYPHAHRRYLYVGSL